MRRRGLPPRLDEKRPLRALPKRVSGRRDVEFSPEGASGTESRREPRPRRLFGAGGRIVAGISSEVGPPAPFSRRRVRCRSDCVRELPPGAKMTPEQGLAKQSRTRGPYRRRRGDALAPTRGQARHPVHKNRGCRSKFWVPLSITPRVPFPYLRLRKELESSYSAIRPKRTGNRDFCAGARLPRARYPLVGIVLAEFPAKRAHASGTPRAHPAKHVRPLKSPFGTRNKPQLKGAIA